MEMENNMHVLPLDLAKFKQDEYGLEKEAISPPRDSGDDLVLLSRVSAAISSLGDLESILHIGLDSVLNIMDGVAGGIMLLDEQTKTLAYRVYHGLSDTYVKGMSLKLGEGITGKVAQSGRAALVEDISLEPNVTHSDLMSMADLRAFLSIPLQAEGNILGVLNIASHVPHRFSQRDMHILHSIGDLLGIAIEHIKLHEQLRKDRERYRQLARQVIMVGEEERRRIARELHDETSQTLTGLALNLQVLMEMAETAGVQDAGFKTRLRKTQELAVRTSTEVSRLIADLRPAALDTLGLVPAIRQYAESNLSSLGVDVSFEFDDIGKSLAPEGEVGLFRWAQGAIGNIIQHSQAKHATISLKQEGDEFVLCIADNGKGFDVSEITGIEQGGRGAGLFSMKERIKILGGNCSIQSQPGQGTKAIARLPITLRTSDAKDKGSSDR